MRRSISGLSPKRGVTIVASAVLLMAMAGHALRALNAQSAPTAAEVPDLAGISVTQCGSASMDGLPSP